MLTHFLSSFSGYFLYFEFLHNYIFWFQILCKFNHVFRIRVYEFCHPCSDWPFMANLHNFCTAVIVGKQFALTTGTCCLQPLNRILYMGSHGTRDASGQTERLISDFRLAPGFDGEELAEDVCIIKWDEPITYSKGEKGPTLWNVYLYDHGWIGHF